MVTWRDYFQTWANQPQVRVQYETTMAHGDRLLKRTDMVKHVSTITPGRYPQPGFGADDLENEDVTLRWFDGRGSLLLPREESATMVIPGFTPLSPALADYFDYGRTGQDPAHARK